MPANTFNGSKLKSKVKAYNDYRWAAAGRKRFINNIYDANGGQGGQQGKGDFKKRKK